MTGLTDSPTSVLNFLYQPPASPGSYNTVPHLLNLHNHHQPQHHHHQQPPPPPPPQQQQQQQQQQMLAPRPFGGDGVLLGIESSSSAHPQGYHQQQQQQQQQQHQQHQQHHHHHQQQHMDHPDPFGDVFNISSEVDVGVLFDGWYRTGYMPPPGDVGSAGGSGPGEYYAQGRKNG